VKVSDTIGALAGAGSLINHGNLTLGGVNTTPVTFSGTMGLSAALGGSGNPIAGRIFTKNGSGTQVISGTLESTGNFDANSTVAAGTLLLNNPTGTSLTTSGATLSVSSGATLGGSGYVLGPVTLAAGGNLSPSAPGATTPLGSIGTFHLGAGTLTANGNTTTTVSALKVDLNTTVANGDTSDLIDASGATVNFVTNTNKAKVDLNNAGTMTGGTYTFLKYGTLSTFANLSLGTTPTGFLAKLVNDTTNKQVQVQVEFLGDFNNDNVVDASDYVVWRKNLGLASGASFTQGDANNDGAVTQADYDVWRANFGKSITVAPGSGLGTQAVPEPATVGLLLAAAAFGVFRRRR
jgi:hypothetical protein